MNALENRQRALSLLDEYEPLLSMAQQDFAVSYFRYDLSLGEIAEAHDISRAAVSDALKKALAKLEDYEEKLGLAKRRKEMLGLLEKAEQAPKEEKLNAYEELGRYIHGI